MMNNVARQNKTPIKLGGRDRGFDEIQERKFEMDATAVTTKMQHALTFGAHEVKTITREGLLWMSSEEIGLALEYATPAVSITRLYNRVADEFSSTMTKVIKVMTAGGKQAVRFFSLRGAHLLAMFARTAKAKEFRVWVLDILDREVGDMRAQLAKGLRLDDQTARDIQSLCTYAELLRSWWVRIEPGIRLLSRPLAANVNDIFVHAALNSRAVVRSLGLRSNHEWAQDYPWEADSSERRKYSLTERP
jgi:prophage antirepressor-like protein